MPDMGTSAHKNPYVCDNSSNVCITTCLSLSSVRVHAACASFYHRWITTGDSLKETNTRVIFVLYYNRSMYIC